MNLAKNVILHVWILFLPSFPVKSQRFFAQNSVFPIISIQIPEGFFSSRYSFSLHSQWNPRGCPRNLVKNHTKSDQNQWCPGNFDRQFWHCVMTRYPQKNLEIQCSAYKASFEKAQNFVKMCVSHNSLKLEIWSFWLEFEQKKGNCHISKHSISLTFIYFYYPKADILKQYSSIVVQFPQNETFFEGFSSTEFAPNASHLFKCLATKIRLLEGFASPQCTPEMRNETMLENFQPLCTWNETILEDFHTQWSWHNPK